MNEQDKQNNEWMNAILKFLHAKHIGQWTKESEIEKHFKDMIPGYNVTTNLAKMHREELLDYSRNMCEYKINDAGRAFFTKGGYK